MSINVSPLRPHEPDRKGEPSPWHDEMEITLIGSVFYEPEVAAKALGIVAAGDFEHRPHNVIWAAIERVHRAGGAPDPTAVREELRSRRELDSAGGSPYLAKIVEIVPTSANMPYAARLVRERALWRRIRAADDFGTVRTLLEGIAADGELPKAVAALDVVNIPPLFFVGGLIPDREPTSIFGRAGALKTTIMLLLAGASAAGDRFLGFDCVSGSSLFVTAEDAAGVLRNRLEALCRGHGWDLDHVLSRVHFLEPEGHVLEDPAWQSHLIGEAERVGARSVLLDPLIFLTNAKENSNDENRPVVAFLKRLAREVGGPVIFGHHETKPHEERRKAVDRLRGASAILNATRAALHLEIGSESTLTVTNVRQSRAPLYPAFAVEIQVETVHENEAEWYSARLTRSSLAPVTIQAETAILDALREAGTLNSNALKAKVSAIPGIEPRDVKPARDRLEDAGFIAFEPGPNRSQNWHLTSGGPIGGRSPENPVGVVGLGSPDAEEGEWVCTVGAPTTRPVGERPHAHPTPHTPLSTENIPKKVPPPSSPAGGVGIT